MVGPGAEDGNGEFAETESSGDDGGDFCTTVGMCLTPLSCALKHNQARKFYVMCI